MDIKKVLGFLLGELEKEDVRYALIGGFALGLLGVPRATVDIDFLVLREDIAKIDKIMKAHNYKCVNKTENVSQYISPLKIFGEVDFLHAFRKISVGMLKRAFEERIDEKLKIKILRPEDIIGLKLQALANDESRAGREYADIESLLEHYNVKLEWDDIEEYFSIFGLNKKFKEYKKRFCRAA